MIEAYPLYWPEGWKRTAYPKRSQFKGTFGSAVVFLRDEVARLGASHLVISTNVPVRQDGLPLASARVPKDQGVAAYFVLKGKQLVIACDRYVSLAENTKAIAKTIEAFRGIERWGASSAMERAFSGFAALPPPAVVPVAPVVTYEEPRRA